MAVAWYKSITPHSVHINWHQLKSHTLDNVVDWSGMDTSPFDAYAEPHIHGHLLNLFIDHTSLMQFPLYFRSGKNELFSNYFVLCRTFNALGIHFDIYTLVCCYHSTHIQPIHTTCTISIDIPALNNTGKPHMRCNRSCVRAMTNNVIHCHFQASLRLIHRGRCREANWLRRAHAPVNWNSIELTIVSL